VSLCGLVFIWKKIIYISTLPTFSRTDKTVPTSSVKKNKFPFRKKWSNRVILGWNIPLCGNCCKNALKAISSHVFFSRKVINGKHGWYKLESPTMNLTIFVLTPFSIKKLERQRQPINVKCWKWVHFCTVSIIAVVSFSTVGQCISFSWSNLDIRATLQREHWLDSKGCYGNPGGRGVKRRNRSPDALVRMLWAPNHYMGAEKSQQSCKCYLQYRPLASEKPQVRTWVAKVVSWPGCCLTSVRPCRA